MFKDLIIERLKKITELISRYTMKKQLIKLFLDLLEKRNFIINYILRIIERFEIKIPESKLSYRII